MLMADTTEPGLDVDALRADFPILDTRVHNDRPLVYLDNAATTQRPRQVIECIERVYKSAYSNVHRGSHYLSNLSTDLYEEARRVVKDFVNAQSENEIVFTTGTTMAVNLIARSWGDQNVGSGDEILLTEMEHHSNIVPWQQLAERTGCTVRFLPITDDGFLDLRQLDEYLTEQTRMFAFTAVSNVLGTINPVRELVARAHQVGAIVAVDAAQSVPHEPTDVQSWNADFVSFSGHKMLAPSGVGVLYGRESLLESMPPFLGGGSMIRSVTKDGYQTARLPAKFEAGTPPIVSVLGLTTAVEYLQNIGLENILAHERMLATYAYERLSEIEGTRLLGPTPEVKAGVISFDMAGIDGYDLAHIVDRQGVAIRVGHHCAMPLHQRLGLSTSCRASFYLYNRLDEVDILIDALLKAKQMLS
jgi:cysteine desulfurase/selenocysteine lyase